MSNASTWDSRYATGDTPWEKGRAHPELTSILQRFLTTGPVLVPGCGTGHDVRAIAHTGVRVLGVDISAEAVKRAGESGSVGLESYQVADFLKWNAEEPFQGVFEHTCFCAIDPALREEYAKTMGRLLKPGGMLIAVFFLDPGLDPGETGPPFAVTPEELNRLFSPNFTLLESWIPVSTYPGREGRELCCIYQTKEK